MIKNVKQKMILILVAISLGVFSGGTLAFAAYAESDYRYPSFNGVSYSHCASIETPSAGVAISRSWSRPNIAVSSGTIACNAYLLNSNNSVLDSTGYYYCGALASNQWYNAGLTAYSSAGTGRRAQGSNLYWNGTDYSSTVTTLTPVLTVLDRKSVV
jgi:hypothetical protein